MNCWFWHLGKCLGGAADGAAARAGAPADAVERWDMAAEQTGRRPCGIELGPAYVDVVIRRWQAATGKAAVLAGTEFSFADIDAQRSVPTPQAEAA
jgi:hypothetical protein